MNMALGMKANGRNHEQPANALAREFGVDCKNIRMMQPDEHPYVQERNRVLAARAGIAAPILCTHEDKTGQNLALNSNGMQYITFSQTYLENYQQPILDGTIGHEMAHHIFKHSLKSKRALNLLTVAGAATLCLAVVGICQIPLLGVAANLALSTAATVLVVTGIYAAIRSIVRKQETDASCYSARLNGSANWFMQHYGNSSRRARLEEHYNGLKGFKKFITGKKYAGVYDIWEGASFAPKNLFDKILTKALHIILNDHPSVKQALKAVEKSVQINTID